AGRLQGRRGRLHRAQALRGVQPGGLGDRVRRHPDRPAVLPRPRPRRHRAQGLSERGLSYGSAPAVRHTRRVSTIPEIRTLPVPDGLEGERVDAAISRMFGFSRTKAAELAAAGKVTVDGSVVGKSERVSGGAWLEVEVPA